MSNNEQMKIKLIEKINKIIEANPNIRMKIIANKENKRTFIQPQKFISNLFACFGFFMGFCFLYSFMTGGFENVEKTLINAFGICAFPFIAGFVFYFYGKRTSSLHIKLSKIFDNNDYTLLYRAGSKEDKEILDFRKYIDTTIKYKEVGI